MAGSAVLRRRLVEEYGLGIYDLGEFVTFRAAHVLVCSTQWEFRSLLVIKQGRLPLHAVVTIGAMSDVGLGELLAVNVLVAVFADSRSHFEIHVHQFGFKIWRLVAVDAIRRLMRTDERKFRL